MDFPSSREDYLTSSTWLDCHPLAAGVNIGLPLPAGSSGICIPDIAGDNPCDIGPSLPWTLDFNVGVTILGGVVHHALAKYLRVAEH